MTYSFEQYLIKLGQLSVDYTYTPAVLYENIAYFKSCFDNNLSEYKALEWFNFYLTEKNIAHRDN